MIGDPFDYSREMEVLMRGQQQNELLRQQQLRNHGIDWGASVTASDSKPEKKEPKKLNRKLLLLE